MKLNETIEQIRAVVCEDDTPVVWFTGDRRSLLLVQMLQIVREGTPAIIFPMFWPPSRTKVVTKILNGIGIRAYTLSPIKAVSDGEIITSEYLTDVFRIDVHERFDGSMFSKLIEFEAETKVAPFYLWNKTFLSCEPSDIFTEGKAYFPLEGWSEDELEQAYELLSIPQMGDVHVQLIEGKLPNGDADNTTRSSA